MDLGTKGNRNENADTLAIIGRTMNVPAELKLNYNNVLPELKNR